MKKDAVVYDSSGLLPSFSLEKAGYPMLTAPHLLFRQGRHYVRSGHGLERRTTAGDSQKMLSPAHNRPAGIKVDKSSVAQLDIRIHQNDILVKTSRFILFKLQNSIRNLSRLFEAKHGFRMINKTIKSLLLKHLLRLSESC